MVLLKVFCTGNPNDKKFHNIGGFSLARAPFFFQKKLFFSKKGTLARLNVKKKKLGKSRGIKTLVVGQRLPKRVKNGQNPGFCPFVGTFRLSHLQQKYANYANVLQLIGVAGALVMGFRWVRGLRKGCKMAKIQLVSLF